VLTYKLLFAVEAPTMDWTVAPKSKVCDAPPTFKTVVSLTANTSVPTMTSAWPFEPATVGVLASIVIGVVAVPSAMVTTRSPELVATNAYKFPLLIARAGTSVTPVGKVYVTTTVDVNGAT